jgi:proline racemase
MHQFVNTPLGDYLTTGRSATGTGLSALMADLEREKQEKLGKAIRGY